MSDVKESGLVDWDNVDLPKTKNKINYLRLKSGNTYTVRLFHKPKPVNRYYYNGKSAICANPDTCPVAIKHSNVKPKARYAIIVIDRSDKEVKILEAPAGVFRDFRKFFETNGIDPGGNDGVDFIIKVTGEGLQTRYEVSHKIKPSPFSDEEKDKIRAARANGYVLDEIFKADDPDKIEAKLFGDNAGSSDTGSAEAATTTVKAPAASVQKDDLEWA